jgi:hypothetical protein
MSPQDWGGLYAPVVATAAFLWNVFTWTRSHWTRVVVKISTGPYPLDDNEEDPTYAEVLGVTVLNNSDFPLRVMWVSAGPARVVNTMERLTWNGMEPLPKTVPAHDHVAAFFDWEDLHRHLGRYRKVRVRVSLGNTRVITKHYSDGGIRGIWRQIRRFLPHRRIRIQL